LWHAVLASTTAADSLSAAMVLAFCAQLSALNLVKALDCVSQMLLIVSGLCEDKLISWVRMELMDSKCRIRFIQPKAASPGHFVPIARYLGNVTLVSFCSAGFLSLQELYQ